MLDTALPPPPRPREAGMSGAGYVFETLREEIISLILRPGAVLSRQDLQARFGLSSTPIRDALMKLQEEGLVQVFPQHATLVAPIDIARARQGQFLRRAVELEAVRTLALAPDEALVARLRTLIRRQAAFADLADHEAFSAEDQAFHRAMYAASGADELWHLVRRQSGHIDRLRRLHLPQEGKIREILAAHTALVDAIAAGAPERAQDVLRDHLSRSLDFVDTLKTQHPDFFRA